MLSQKLKYIFISFIITLVALPGVGLIQAARADTVSDMELRLFTLINTARTDPLGTAASLGLDPEQVLEDLPGLAEILTQGLPPVENNDLLHEAAFNHTQDMLTQNYFSKISPDGSTPDDRIAATGYDPNITGETLGILAFYNFIGSETAVNILFKNMFLDELSPERTEPRNILNPAIKDIGIGMGTGVMDLGAGRYNVYLATCDFAAAGASATEQQLLELINQARENPLETAAAMGLNPDEILADLPELTEILTQGIPPVTLNQNLYDAARNHAKDMVENSYTSTTSLDGREVEDRVRDAGYDPARVGESIRMRITEGENDPAEAARICFEKLFRRELNPLTMDRFILNPVFKEVGIGFITAPAGEDTVKDRLYSEYNTAMLVCDFGLSAIDGGWPYLKGRVYTDWNSNGVFNFGEGMAGTVVHIQGPELDLNVYTNSAGGFLVQLEPGVSYRISRSVDGSAEERQMVMGDENMPMDFILTPELQN